MKKVEVLVATMYQKDLAKYKEMNIQTDAVFANQDDKFEYVEEIIDGNILKMITTNQRGVGKNRNTSFLYSTSEICMFADDDMVFYEGYEQGVISAFSEIQDADMIIFNCDINSELKPRVNTKISRVRLWNFWPYGTVRIAVKRESLLRKNIYFTQLFGGGTRYGSGEDSLLLSESLKKGLKVYTHPFAIGMVRNENSTWFKGFNDKYFFDKGAWIAAAFPVLKYVVALPFAFKFFFRTDFTYFRILFLLINGIISFKKGMSYEEWNR